VHTTGDKNRFVAKPAFDDLPAASTINANPSLATFIETLASDSVSFKA
jgi:hypothetical protein